MARRRVCVEKEAEADDTLFLSLSMVLKKSASEETIFKGIFWLI